MSSAQLIADAVSVNPKSVSIVYKSFEYASNHYILKGDHRIYHKDVKIEIVDIYVR